jgi:hypothetical protein
MKRSLGFIAVILASLGSSSLAVEETLCTGGEKCVDDVLSVRFTANNTSALDGAIAGDTIETSVQLDAKEALIEGFSYGVKHDKSILELVAATHEGADPLISHGATDTPPGADIKIILIGQDRLGFIQAVIMTSDDNPPFELPVRDGIKIALATYKVSAVVPPAGTKIEISNEIRPAGSPPTVTNLTVNGNSRQPKKVNNAVLKGVQPEVCSGPDYAFYFGPSATASQYAIPSAQGGVQQAAVSLRNKGAVLGFSLGIKKEGDGLIFQSTLGSPVVEMIVTKDDGKDVSGVALRGNTAKGAAQDITRITKGAALAGVQGDFFGPRILTAAEGGPGATVGYVSDATGNGKVIPAVTDAGGTCGVNEVLLVELRGGGDRGFSRGDGNGDGKISVTDGVIVAQNIFAGKLVIFDCQDMLDVNDDGTLNTADPVVLLTYLFLNGPQPPAPFKTCTLGDPTADALSCSQPNCQ